MAEHPAAATTIPGLPPEASARLLALFSAEPAVAEVWLYGSRAMGRHRPGSDIDLTLVAPWSVGGALFGARRFRSDRRCGDR